MSEESSDMVDDVEYEEEAEPASYDELMDDPEYQADIDEILTQYRQRRLKEKLAGPVVSFLVHAVALLILCLLPVPANEPVMQTIEVRIQPIEIKEPEEPPPEPELELQVEEEVVDAPPMIEDPDVPEEVADPVFETMESELAPQTDDNMEFEEVLDTIPATTPFKMPALFGGRTASGIKSNVKRYGGKKSGQRAVNRGLKWLASVQNDDGSWGTANKPAYSGLATLCFLAHGETPVSEQYGETVQKALRYLADNMPCGKTWDRAYSHGMATYALAEGYGMTQIPFLYAAMECGIATIIKGQTERGGFNYHYKQADSFDLSVSAWQFQALKAAYVAGYNGEGIEEAIEKSLEFLANDASNGKTFGYSGKGGSPNLTGAGALSMQLLGEGDAPEVEGAIDFLVTSRLPGYKWEGGGGNLYGWYYDTQAMFHEGGKRWKAWNKVFQDVLVKAQNRKGYWEMEGGHFGQHLTGRIFATELTLLQLMVYYRYLPTFDIKKMNRHKVGRGGDIEADDGMDLIID